MCGNWHEAEDLTQITLARLFVSWNRVRRQSLATGMYQAHSRHSPGTAGSSVAAGSTATSSPAAPGEHPAKATGPGMTRQQMRATLRLLLPPGSVLSDVRTDTTRGALEADYNDGRGPVDLIIDVSRTSPNPPLNCPHPVSAGGGTRPAGALPVSCAMRVLADGSVERDAVMYADGPGYYGYNIYDNRPDDVTVFIQVANGTNHTLPHVDRPRPPGSMAEWEALAENPAWHL